MQVRQTKRIRIRPMLKAVLALQAAEAQRGRLLKSPQALRCYKRVGLSGQRGMLRRSSKPLLQIRKVRVDSPLPNQTKRKYQSMNL